MKGDSGGSGVSAGSHHQPSNSMIQIQWSGTTTDQISDAGSSVHDVTAFVPEPDLHDCLPDCVIECSPSVDVTSWMLPPMQYYPTDNALHTEALSFLDSGLVNPDVDVTRCLEENSRAGDSSSLACVGVTDMGLSSTATTTTTTTTTASDLSPLPWMKSTSVQHTSPDAVIGYAEGLMGLRSNECNCIACALDMHGACTELEMLNTTQGLFSYLPDNSHFGQDSIFFDSTSTSTWEPLWETGLFSELS